MCECDFSNLSQVCQGLGFNYTHHDLGGAPFNERGGTLEVWGIGLVCVTVISLCSAIGIAILPFFESKTYCRLLTYCVGLGVGTLSGGALFHLIPQTTSRSLKAFLNADDVAKYLPRSWMAALGVYMYFIADRATKIAVEYRKRRKRVRSAANCHQPVKGKRGKLCLPLNDSTEQNSAELTSQELITSISQSNFANDKLFAKELESHGCACHDTKNNLVKNSEDSRSAYVDQETIQKLSHAMCSHDHDVHFQQGDSVVKTVAWMVLFGDGLHNFIDGLAIGAAFTQSVRSGLSVSVAVLCEEFPHELGDVAILLNAGMRPKQALVYNLLSASTCYVGFILGVIAGELDEANAYIFPLAGGMFLYISLATMLPEMNDTATKAMEVRMTKGFSVICLQCSGIFTGLLLMYLMAAYGTLIQF